MNRNIIADYLSQQMQMAPYADGTYRQPVVFVYEIFKQVAVPSLERYYISNMGRLFDTEKMCHCIPLKRDKGSIYYTIRWGYNGVNDFCQKSAQWFMMMTFKPIQNTEGMSIVFLDHNPANLDLDNMEWMNYNQKQQFMVNSGIGSVGENHYQTKYTENQIRRICQLLEKGMKSNQIKLIMTDLPNDPLFDDVCTRLRTGAGWKHVACDYNLTKLNERFGDEFIHKVCDLLEQGKSNKEIAEKLGVEYNVRLQSLCAHLRGHKPTYQRFLDAHPNIPLVTAESRGISLEVTEKIAKLMSEGYKNWEIIQKLKSIEPRLNNSSLSKITQRLKFPKDKNVKGYDIAKKYGLIQNGI